MEVDKQTLAEKFLALLGLVAHLRSTEGCPWDRAQTQEDIGRYLLEESYEVLEALEGGIPAELQEELGDLLFLILFLAHMAAEAGQFDVASLLEGITAKMIRRHPHVFGDTQVTGEADVRRNWEWIKREVEKKGKGGPSIVAGIGRSLPTLTRVQRITAQASAEGFDWPDADGVLDKVSEELAEFKAALAARDRQKTAEEAGDLLFTLVNLCRFAGVDAEASLRASLGKFTDRFSHIEQTLAAQGRTPQDSSLAEMDALWEEAKRKERS